jgi:hypothetical protein
MANFNDNRISEMISKENFDEIRNAFTEISALIPEAALTDVERKSLVSMDVDNRVFADNVLIELDNGGAEIVPAYIKKENLRTDLVTAAQLEQLQVLCSNLLRKISDANRVVSSEAMTVSFLTYNLLSAVAKVGVNGAKEPAMRLAPLFQKLSRKVDPQA